MTPDTRWPILAAAAVGVQVGAAITVTRMIAPDVPPATIALVRYAIGAICLAPFLLQIPVRSMPWRDLIVIAGLGIGQFGVLVALLNFGLVTVPAGRGAVLFASLPVMALGLSAIFNRARLRVLTVVGILFTIAGVFLAVGGDGDWAAGISLGDAAILASAFVGALCSVLYRPYVARYRSLPLGAFAMAASVAFLIAPAIAEGGLVDLVYPFDGRVWAALLFIGLSSAVGYGLWLWALGQAPATHVTMFLSLSPITAALMAAIWLGEAITTELLLGLCLVVTGLLVSHIKGPQRQN